MQIGDLVYVDSDIVLIVSNPYLLKRGVYMIDIIFKGKKKPVRTTCIKEINNEARRPN